MPTALKLAKGVPGHHALNHDEPELDPPSATTPPKELSGVAREEWIAQIDTLIEKGILTSGDMNQFRQYCTMAGEADSLERYLAKSRVWTNQRLRLSRYLLQLRSRLTQQAAHFGLTPSSRSGVKAVKPTANAADAKRSRFFGARKDKPA